MKWFEELSGQYGEFANSTNAAMALIRMKQNKPKKTKKKNNSYSEKTKGRNTPKGIGDNLNGRLVNYRDTKSKRAREYTLFTQGSDIICKVRIGGKEVETLIDLRSENSSMNQTFKKNKKFT